MSQYTYGGVPASGPSLQGGAPNPTQQPGLPKGPAVPTPRPTPVKPAAPTPAPPAPAGPADNPTVQPMQAPTYSFTPNTNLMSVNPQTDASYLTFLSGAGYSTDLAKAQAARQRAALQASLAAGEQGFDQSLQQGLTGDLNAAAARGGVNSSARLLSQANTTQNVNNQRANFEAGISDKMAQAQDSLENTLANSRIQQAQQEMASRQRLLDQQNALAQQQAAQQYAQSLLQYLSGGGH